MKTYAAAVILMAIAVVIPAGQQPNPSWNGAYTTAQAQRGQTLYTANCAN